MEFRQLRHFVAVVESGSLSRGADAAGISQPALTRSIRLLEETLGARLLDRLPRGVVPTEAGRSFLASARLILSECQRASSDVKAIRKGVKGQVALGIGPLFAAHFVDRAVLDIGTAHPGLELMVVEGFYEWLIASLIAGKLDLIFSNFPVAALDPNLVFEPVGTVNSMVVAGRDHPLARAAKVGKAELAAHPWVAIDQPHVVETVDRYFGTDGFPSPSTPVRTNSLTLLRALVVSGRYLTMISDVWMLRELKRGEVRRIAAPGTPIVRGMGLITRKDAVLRPAVAITAAALRAAAAEPAVGAPVAAAAGKPVRSVVSAHHPA